MRPCIVALCAVSYTHLDVYKRQGVKGARKPPEIKRIPCIAKSIYKLGYPSICMQALYTVYIAILNIILAGFCDEAVTVLGLYYKAVSYTHLHRIPLSSGAYLPLKLTRLCLKEYLCVFRMTRDISMTLIR